MKKLQIDIIGISSASLCLIHCIGFPLLTLLPFGFSHDHTIDAFFACIGIWVVLKIVRSNTSKTIKFILGISIFLIVVSVLIDLLFHIHSFLIYIGGVGMIVGHYLNFKRHKINFQLNSTKA